METEDNNRYSNDGCPGDGQTRQMELTPTPKRRHSNISERAKSAVNAFNYDSGNCCNSSNASDSGAVLEFELLNSNDRFHYVLREKDQALFLALQDVRKLRSELERLSKSEQWYKQELRVQKSTRLEALERLYTQERKYMIENQRLQRECVRLYSKCGEMENELEEQREKALQTLSREALNLPQSENSSEQNRKKFEIEQQKGLISDQQQLINILRKQKRTLLDDLQRLGEEKDEKLLELQKTLANMEVENTRITTKCKQLIKERRNLEENLQSKETTLNMESVAIEKLQTQKAELKEQLLAQEQTLLLKENEIIDLQTQFKMSLKHETSADEVHRLSVAYHEEVSTKTSEIASLKNYVFTLEQELGSLADLQALNEEQERVIENLNFSLEARQFELVNLKETDAKKAQQIAELQLNIESLQRERETTLQNLAAVQTTLKTVEKELISLNEQYAQMCAFCERTRFDLEMREIEQAKLKFEAESDKREIEELRGKLIVYMKQTAELIKRIKCLEKELDTKVTEKIMLENNMKRVEKQLSKVSEVEQSVTKTHFLENSINEIENMKTVCKINEELIEQLQEENQHLKVMSNVVEKEEVLVKNCEFPFSNKNSDEPSQSNKIISNLKFQLNEQQYLISNLEAENISLRLQMNELVDSNALASLESDNEQFTATILENIDTQNEFITEKSQLPENFEITINDINSDLQEHQKSAECDNLKLKLKNQYQENQMMQQKLLGNDAKLYKMQKEERGKQQEHENKVKAFEAISEENAKLKEELERAVKITSNLEAELTKDKEIINDLKNQQAQKKKFNENETELVLIKTKLQKYADLMENEKNLLRFIKDNAELYIMLQKDFEPITSTENKGETSNDKDILSLRAKVQDLEHKLQQSEENEAVKREERVKILNKMLEHQNDKMVQLNSTQSDWEELLKALKAAQAMEESTKTELQLKRVELEELNELFSEQNEELQRLQEFSYQMEQERLTEHKEQRGTFQQQINVMQEKLSDKLKENDEQTNTIEEMKGKNGRLAKNLNKDYEHELSGNKKQIGTLQAQGEKIQAERNEYVAKMKAMEKEMNKLKKDKRGAVIMPELVLFRESSTSCDVDKNDESQCNESCATFQSSASSSLVGQAVDDRLRILTNVLESEYSRKMKRYDLHIRALLNNVKCLKKALRGAEQKAILLKDDQAKTSEELQDLQMTRRHLEEMRMKFEQSQHTVKALEQALQSERKKFESSDLGKSTHQETTHEASNLIDDYKKLIQQSSIATYRPKTSAILELIQRSNQCVPNLNKLESTVENLRSDIQHFIENYTQYVNGNSIEATTLKIPSLMDELRAATENV